MKFNLKLLSSTERNRIRDDDRSHRSVRRLRKSQRVSVAVVVRKQRRKRSLSGKKVEAIYQKIKTILDVRNEMAFGTLSYF
jgi:hypothetical protein